MQPASTLHSMSGMARGQLQSACALENAMSQGFRHEGLAHLIIVKEHGDGVAVKLAERVHNLIWSAISAVEQRV